MGDHLRLADKFRVAAACGFEPFELEFRVQGLGFRVKGLGFRV